MQKSPDAPRSLIVNREYPVDSLGETVYKGRGNSEEDRAEPIVPGVLVDPRALSQPNVKYSKAMKKAKYSGDVPVLCVITATGRVIDVTTSPNEDVEAAASAREAVAKYRFDPATLDGKPIAVRLKVIVNFRIY